MKKETKYKKALVINKPFWEERVIIQTHFKNSLNIDTLITEQLSVEWMLLVWDQNHMIANVPSGYT